MSDGASFADCQRVIRVKTREWKGTSQEKYLRPETLFNATKFQGYVNEPEEVLPALGDQQGYDPNRTNQLLADLDGPEEYGDEPAQLPPAAGGDSWTH